MPRRKTVLRMIGIIFISLFTMLETSLAGNLLIGSASPNVGNDRTNSVVVMEKGDVKELFSGKHANWEVYTSRGEVNALLISDDKMTLWVATEGGLEERDAHNGKLKKIYTNLDGLPNNHVKCIASDGSGGIWVGTNSGGLAHLTSDGMWKVFDPSNSSLPGYYVTFLLSDGSGGIWVEAGGSEATMAKKRFFPAVLFT